MCLCSYIYNPTSIHIQIKFSIYIYVSGFVCVRTYPYIYIYQTMSVFVYASISISDYVCAWVCIDICLHIYQVLCVLVGV